MKKTIILFFAATLLLSVSSCRSTKKFFVDSQQTTSNTNVNVNVNETKENLYDMSMDAPVEKKSSYTSVAKVQNQILPMNIETTLTMADLTVFPDKVQYSCAYNGDDSEAVRKAAINYAMSQAVRINGGDVMIEPSFEVTVVEGKVTNVKVYGYVGKYTNFRVASQADLNNLKETRKAVASESNDKKDAPKKSE